ncbi:hypothetical protein AALP_AAs74702U000100, partial [Arabis alpina]
SKVILDSGNYGFWKSRMKVIIGGIDVMAWRAVLVQWTAPIVVDADGVSSLKPEDTWTEDELKKAKFNSRALSAIHCSVTKKTFELIQGCETAEETWDLLQLHFEGTQKVQNSRKDMLASRFENLKMDEHESIFEFSSKLKSLSQEAATLGKKYKDTKLVKKFLLCLPVKFMAYKSALTVSHNIESLSFGDVVGMLQAHELELESLVTDTRKTMNLALTCEKKNSGSEDDTDAVERSSKRPEVQCFECKGFGHFKTDCPTVKRRELKCFGCKGLGHTQLECVNDQKFKKDRAMIAEEDSEEESEDEEILNNFVTFVGIVEFDEGHAGSESDDEQDDDDDLVKSYRDVREALLRIGLENTVLAKEKLRLEAMVEALQAELQAEKKLSLESVSLMKEKLILATKADMWEKELYAEKEVTAQL